MENKESCKADNPELHKLVHSHLSSLQEMLQELFLALMGRIDKLDLHLDEIFKGLERICMRLDNLESLLKTRPGPDEDKIRESWTSQDDELPSI